MPPFSSHTFSILRIGGLTSHQFCADFSPPCSTSLRLFIFTKQNLKSPEHSVRRLFIILGKTFSARIQFPDSGWFPFLLLFPSGSLLKSEGTSEEFLESPVYPIYNPLYGSFPPVFWSPSERQKTFYNVWEKHSRLGFHFQTRSRFLLRSQFLLEVF